MDRGKVSQILILVRQVWPLCPPTKTSANSVCPTLQLQGSPHRTLIHCHGHITGCIGATKGKLLREPSAAVPKTAVLLS